MSQSEHSTIRQALEKSFIFKNALSESMDLLVEKSSLKSVKKSEVVFVEGEPCRYVYVLVSGRMIFLMHDENGKRYSLGLVADHAMFGDMEVFTKGIRVSHAEAHEDSAVVQIDSADFVDIVRKDANILFNIVRFYASLLERLSRFSLFRNVEKQLAYILLDFAKRYGKAVRLDLDLARPTEGIEIDLNMSQEFLGSLVGVPRQRVNTTLKSWEAKSWIRVNYNRITILDERAMKKYSVI